MKQFLIENIGAILVFVLGVLAWFGERYKRKQSEISMTKDIVSLYKTALSDFEKRYELEIENFNKTIKELRDDLKSWQFKYSGLERKYKELKSQFDNYRQKHN